MLIVGVLYTNSRTIYGLTKSKLPKYRFIPFDRKLPEMFVGSRRSSARPVWAIVRGTAEALTSEFDGSGSAQLEQIIGQVYLDPLLDCQAFLRHWGLPHKNIRLREPGMLGSVQFPWRRSTRTDLTDLPLFVIDPDGCQDHDDAFHFVRDGAGGMELGVHIADPWYFMEPQALPTETGRWSSVYFLGRTVHMLPPEVAAEMFAPGKKTPCISLIFRSRDSGGMPVSCELESIALSWTMARKSGLMTYESAASDRRLDGPLEFVRRLNREIRLLPDIADVHDLVQFIMVLSNKAVAELLEKNFPMRVPLRTYVEPQAFCQDSPEQSTDSVDPEFSRTLVRLATEHAPARYALAEKPGENLHQFGVYAHFTSPLRRAVDLYLHWMCHGLLLSAEKFRAKVDAVDFRESRAKVDAIDFREFPCWIEPESLCAHANEFQNKVKKFSRQVRRIELVHSLNARPLGASRHAAYVVSCEVPGKLRVFVPELELVENVRIFPQELSGELSVNANQWEQRLANPDINTGTGCPLNEVVWAKFAPGAATVIKRFQRLVVEVTCIPQYPAKPLKIRVVSFN
ncbi:MAG: ribonuclease catalytic domain-containing protein [Sulfobacillus sp.]